MHCCLKHYGFYYICMHNAIAMIRLCLLLAAFLLLSPGHAQVRNIQYLCDPPVHHEVPMHFSLGSMGGFFTFSEAENQLDSMRFLFPDLITAKQQIGTSIEGRPIWQVCISDDPGVSAGEPMLLLTSLHHSQEPASLQQLIMFMWYLLENYDTDPEIRHLVDTREIHFVPVINPDGYVYNQTQNPGGGGTWRKNRRPNGLFNGVDLNRNYGYAFGYDELGSSSLGVHPWYRGDSAFSEPESRAMRDFILAHDFRLAMNWHAYGNYLIYPWNYETLLTPDSTLFEQYSRYLTLQSHYRYGTCDQTYGYNSNGDADDWAYGDTSKAKIISFTAEIGSAADGFWPDPANITELCRQTIDMNLRFTRLAGPFALANDNGTRYLDHLNGSIPLEVYCLGVESPADFTLGLQGISPWITATGPAVNTGNMNTLERLPFSISYTLDPATPPGTELRFLVQISEGGFTRSDTLFRTFTPVDTLFADACNDFSQWANTGWSVSGESFFSPPSAFNDSPGGPYGILQSKSVEMLQPVDLSAYQSARLQFKARWMMEIAYDWMQVYASADNGSVWLPLCGRYSSYGSDDQSLAEPVYDGFVPGWVTEEIDLVDFLGGTVTLKFTFSTDQTHNFDGAFLDDIYILAAVNPSGAGHSMNEFRGCRLFPNPCSDDIFIDAAGRLSSDSRVRITDLSGKELLEKSFAADGGNIQRLDVSDLSQGMFLLEFISGGCREVKKLFISR